MSTQTSVLDNSHLKTIGQDSFVTGTRHEFDYIGMVPVRKIIYPVKDVRLKKCTEVLEYEETEANKLISDDRRYLVIDIGIDKLKDADKLTTKDESTGEVRINSEAMTKKANARETIFANRNGELFDQLEELIEEINAGNVTIPATFVTAKVPTYKLGNNYVDEVSFFNFGTEPINTTLRRKIRNCDWVVAQDLGSIDGRLRSEAEIEKDIKSQQKTK